MKKLVTFALSLSLALSLTACGGGAAPSEAPETTAPAAESAPAETPAAEAVELHVYAAASLTESLNQIAENYKAVAPNVTITYTFDSSGTLKTQIEEGGDCDLFLSAAQKQMNGLAEGGYIDEGSRVDLLENKVTLAVPQGNPAGVASFEDVNTDKVKMIALGNADVPVGQYSQELFTAMGVWDAIQDKITFGSNVKEVTTWVGESAVDCGVVYATDAFSAGLEVVAEADPALLTNQVIYPAAVLAASAHKDEAQAFLDYLKTDESVAVFEAVGFAMAK
ncbi:molybdate ABC transporter substrate-binding protein [Pseudoflavonifractor phocaeensis]|uniref:molybdate ABC transporter substrate-binding protein n=1 Tax=Pseudoflavonifractor phocaeensis TaxID=1870988 RepID=UPI00313C26A6